MAKKQKKVEPCQVDLTFQLVPAEGTSMFYIDLAKSLSAINRRLYRSGYVYATDGITVQGVAGEIFAISKIPEGYVSENAWKKAFNHWKKQRAETIDGKSGVTGKWSDFKVYYDAFQNPSNAAGFYPTVLPMVTNQVGSAEVDYTGAEWNYSDITWTDTGGVVRVMPVGMLGPDQSHLYGGIIEAYGDTRRTSHAEDPNLPPSFSTSWIEHMGPASGEMETDIENLVEIEGDQPPYAITEDPADPIYLGGATTGNQGISHCALQIPTTNAPLHVQGGAFPLGQMLVTTGASGATITIHCSRGFYRGVAARPMGE